jgi:hypothetical protein
MITLALIFALFLTPALAQDAPAVDETTEVSWEETEAAAPDEAAEAADELEEAAETIGALRAAIESKQWPVVIGILLTGIVYILRRVGLEERVNAKALPWITLVLATSANIGAALAAGIAVVDTLWTALYTASIAMASWDLSAIFASDADTETNEESD